MEKINIESDDFEELEALIYICKAYKNVLHYLLIYKDLNKDNQFIQEKFTESILYNIELEKCKTNLQYKYFLSKNFDEYKINFLE